VHPCATDDEKAARRAAAVRELKAAQTKELAKMMARLDADIVCEALAEEVPEPPTQQQPGARVASVSRSEEIDPWAKPGQWRGIQRERGPMRGTAPMIRRDKATEHGAVGDPLGDREATRPMRGVGTSVACGGANQAAMRVPRRLADADDGLSQANCDDLDRSDPLMTAGGGVQEHVDECGDTHEEVGDVEWLVERDRVLSEEYRKRNKPAMRVAALEAKACHAEVTSRGDSRGGPDCVSERGRVDGRKGGGGYGGNHLGQWHEEVANGSSIVSEIGMGAEVKGALAKAPPEKRYDRHEGRSYEVHSRTTRTDYEGGVGNHSRYSVVLAAGANEG